MATVFEKLNLGNRQEIVVLHAPESFRPELAKLPVMTPAQPRGIRAGGELLACFCDTKERGGQTGAANCEAGQGQCDGVVRLSQGHVEEVHMRLQSRYGVGCFEGSRLRHRASRGHRRGLDSTAVPTEGIYQAALAPLAGLAGSAS